MTKQFCVAALTAACCLAVAAPSFADGFRSSVDGRYLDIHGGNGAIMTSDHPYAGADWRVTDHGNYVTLQVTARQFNGCYLDIDGADGKLMLSDRLVEGAKWQVVSLDGNRVALKNVSRSKYRGNYLDIHSLRLSRFLTPTTALYRVR